MSSHCSVDLPMGSWFLMLKWWLWDWNIVIVQDRIALDTLHKDHLIRHIFIGEKRLCYTVMCFAILHQTQLARVMGSLWYLGRLILLLLYLAMLRAPVQPNHFGVIIVLLFTPVLFFPKLWDDRKDNENTVCYLPYFISYSFVSYLKMHTRYRLWKKIQNLQAYRFWSLCCSRHWFDLVSRVAVGIQPVALIQ